MNRREPDKRHARVSRALNPMMSRRIRLLTPLVAGLLLTVAAPVSAAPTGTAVAKIYQLPCRAQICGSSDKVIAANALVRGSVQLQVTSRSSLGLSSLRLEASINGGSYVCWRTWTLQGPTETTQAYDWDTNTRPDSCGASDGGVGRNVRVAFRAIATERASGDTHTSPTIALRANNRPATPEWESAPRSRDPEDGGPSVDLAWRAGPEPDILEYHYVRIDPNGDEVEFAVDAFDPARQGCGLDAGIYTCRDTAFTSKGFGGRHTYLLVAYRSSESDADSCALASDQGCIQSETSSTRAATLNEPVDPDEVEEEPSARPATVTSTTKPRARGPRPVGNGTSYASLAAGKYYENGAYKSELPYDSLPLLSPPDDDQPPIYAAGQQDPDPVGATLPSGRQRWLYLAAGIMALVVAAHVARLARDPH